METVFNKTAIKAFEEHLYSEERSKATVEKYLRDVGALFSFLGEREVTKGTILEYKGSLLSKYLVTSANSMIAAINAFFRFLGRLDLCVKQYKIQKSAFIAEEKELSREEYVRLVETAKRKKNERLSLVLQTICGSGIRVSELQYITVEAVERGEAIVNCKGKNRRIFIIPALKKQLLEYIRKKKLSFISFFI